MQLEIASCLRNIAQIINLAHPIRSRDLLRNLVHRHHEIGPVDGWIALTLPLLADMFMYPRVGAYAMSTGILGSTVGSSNAFCAACIPHTAHLNALDNPRLLSRKTIPRLDWPSIASGGGGSAPFRPTELCVVNPGDLHHPILVSVQIGELYGICTRGGSNEDGHKNLTNERNSAVS
jgi:hypothetical protein